MCDMNTTTTADISKGTHIVFQVLNRKKQKHFDMLKTSRN